MCQLVTNNIIADMHNHTRASDGLQSPFRTILRAYNNGINVIAFSDHNSVRGFRKLEEQFYSILEIIKDNPYEINVMLDILENVKVLKGTELITSYNGVIVEVLGYNFDLNKMDNEIGKLKNIVKEKPYEVLYNSFNAIIDKNGLVFDKTVLDEPYNNIKLGRRGGLTVPFFNELISHKENIKYLTYIDSFGEEKIADTLKLFINKHLYRMDSMFFVDMSKTRPSFQDTIDAIHKAGGIAFLAHPGRYKDKINIEDYLDDMISCGLDGLEVFYPSHSFDFRKMLLDKVKEHKLMASGDSDDHCSIKEGYEYKTGTVSIPNIPETKWISDAVSEKKDFFSESVILQQVLFTLKSLNSQNIKRKL